MKRLRKIMTIVLAFIMMLVLVNFEAVIVFAETTEKQISGKRYSIDDSRDYLILDEVGESTENGGTMGKLVVKGEIENTSVMGDLEYLVVKPEGKLEICYLFDKAELDSRKDEEWKITNEIIKKKINSDELENTIKSGAVLVQTSKDGLNWGKIVEYEDFFACEESGRSPLCETTDIQLNNGCYYKITVAYKVSRKIGTVIFGVPKNESKKVIETYVFYASYSGADINPEEPSPKYELGSKVRTKDDVEGYAGNSPVSKEDVHYGWNLGKFFVGGYTEAKTDGDTTVFLKNVGDIVSLWFNLEQNIDALNKNDKLRISEDKDGCDEYFETARQNMGRGTLIIRFTDYQNVVHNPVIYTDFLSANASIGANTKIQLFEEGDYEVALDYEIENKKLISQKSHYRIFFKFSVRNSNCMVFPRDVLTGSELTDTSVTKNGFVLDLVKSKYLSITLKRSVLTEGADGLVEDTRFNGSAKEGTEYREEGIYTITVKNKYTGAETEKKIYVGENKVLIAHVVTGKSIQTINKMVSEGAKILENGTIVESSIEHTPTPSATDKPSATNIPTETDNPSETIKPSEKNERNGNVGLIVGLAGFGVLVCGIVCFLLIRIKKLKEKKE